MLGGGSNLVVADEGFAGHGRRGRAPAGVADVEGDDATCGGVVVTVAAGERWDDLVARAVGEGWVGIEALSGIPGSVGATPIQNVGAYGQEVAADHRLGPRLGPHAAGRPHLRRRRLRLRLPHQPVQGRPRRATSSSTVTFQLRQGDLGAPVEYAELARTLGVEPGERAPLADVREAVLGCAAARAWCSTPTTTTPGAPARSSPTRSSTPAGAARGAPALAAARRRGQDQRRLADRARRLRQGLRRPGRVAALDQAHPGAHQPRRRDDRRAAGPGPRGPRRGRAALRHPAGQRAGARRLRAASR